MEINPVADISPKQDPKKNRKQIELIIQDEPISEELQVIEILKTINWQKFNQLCKCLGRELNDHQWRFLKAVFLERAVSRYSGNRLTYVGQEGCDFIIGELNNLTIEMKFVSECLFTCKTLAHRKNTKQITLLNSKGTNKHTTLPEKYANYLLIVEMNGAAIISKEKLQTHVSVNGDSLSAIVPASDLQYIFTPSDIDSSNTITPLLIRQKITNLIDEIIDDA